MRRGEDYLTSIEMHSRYRFRDLGILCAYIGFNLMLAFALYYLFREHRWKKAAVKPATKKGKKGKKGKGEAQEEAQGVVENV